MIDCLNHKSSEKILKNLFICFILLDINKDTNNDKISQILIIHTFNILYNIQYYNII